MAKRGERSVKRTRSLTGYRLHAERLAFTSAVQKTATSAIRTVKLPLHAAESDLSSAFHAVRADYLAIHGPIAFEDWLNSSKNSYSLIDFWLDAVSLGGIFASSASLLQKLALQLAGDDPVKEFEHAYTSIIPPDIAAMVDWKEASDFFSQDLRAKPTRVFKDSTEFQPQAALRKDAYLAGLESLRNSHEYKHSTDKAALLRRHRENALFDLRGASHISKEIKGASEDPNGGTADLKLTFILIPSKILQAMPSVSGELLSAPWQHPHAVTNVDSFVSSCGRSAAAESSIHFVSELSARLGDETDTAELLGLTQNFNGFQNFFNAFIKTLKSDPNDVAQAMLNCYPVSKRAEIRDELFLNCEILASLARRLPSPQVASTWADYRSFLGGEIQSWFSNRIELVANLQKDLESKDEALDGVQAVLSVEALSTDPQAIRSLALSRDSKSLIASILRALADRMSGKWAQQYELLESLLAELNVELNQLDQRHSLFSPAKEAPKSRRQSRTKAKFAETKNSEQRDIRRALSTRLRRVPSFIGESKKQEYPRFQNAPRLLTWCIETLQATFKGQEIEARHLRPEEVESLIRWVSDAAQYGSQEEKILSETGSAVRALLPLRKYARAKRPFCYKGQFNRQRLSPVLAESDFERWLSARPELTTPTLSEWFSSLFPRVFAEVQAGREKSLPFFRSLLRLWPRIVDMGQGLHAAVEQRLMPILNEFFCLSPNHAAHRAFFPRLWAYLEFIGLQKRVVSVDESQAHRILSRLYTECSALIALTSYSSFITRYSLQQQNGAQTNLLVEPVPTGGRERFWVDLVNLPYPLGNPPPPPAKLFMRAQSVDRSLPNAPFRGTPLEIRSSRYQVQFLRKALSEPRPGACSFTPGGSFLIGERDVKLHANWKTGIMEVQQDLAPPRLFASIPFTLGVEAPEEKSRHHFVETSSKEATSGRVIGIDIGEYALTSSVVNWHFDGKRVTFSLLNAEDRVIQEGAHRVLKDEVSRLKKRQVRGTFSTRSSAVANLRESLIGAYRAKLHDLAVRYNAPLVFERQVSAFEAGGNRIKKIYDSVKISDTVGDSDADKKTKLHYWGKERNIRAKAWRSGVEISAQYTSQLCTACRRLAIPFLSEQLEAGVSPSLQKRMDERGRYLWHEVDLGTSHLRAFLEQQDSVKDAASLERHVRKAMRPPLKRFRRKLPAAAKARRGNSSLFWCPFVDCSHLTDCDVQASFIIAVKSVLKQLFPVEYEEGRWLEILQDRSRVEIPRIDLERQFFRNPYAPTEKPRRDTPA